MALWNPTSPEGSSDRPQTPNPAPTVTPVHTPTPTPTATSAVPSSGIKEGVRRERRESVFGPDVTIEGKIEGDGDVRIGGKFKGDIHIKGELTIDKGAHVNAKVNAANLTLGGELDGNVIAGAQVKLLESAQLVGDLKAATLTVVAGSRMRGQVEFGWSASEAAKFAGDKKRDGEKFEMAER